MSKTVRWVQVKLEIIYDKASTSEPSSTYIANIFELSHNMLLVFKINLVLYCKRFKLFNLEPWSYHWTWAVSLISCKPPTVDFPDIKPCKYNTTPQIHTHLKISIVTEFLEHTETYIP